MGARMVQRWCWCWALVLDRSEIATCPIKVPTHQLMYRS